MPKQEESLAISHIETVQMPTRHLPTAVQFYAEALGLARGAASVAADPAEGYAQFELRRGASLMLAAPRLPYQAAEGHIVAMEVERGSDIGGLLARVEQAGGHVTYRDVRTPDWLDSRHHGRRWECARASDSALGRLNCLPRPRSWFW